MSVTLSQSEDLIRVQLEGAIDIADAAEMKAVLVQALGFGRSVNVVLDGVMGLDVTAVQLLWAAHREAEKLGIGFNFQGKVPHSVSFILNDAGVGEVLQIL